MTGARGLMWASGLAALVLFGVMQSLVGDLSPNIVVLQFAVDPAAFQQVFSAWGDAGVARYRQHFAFDFAFLLAYAVFGQRAARRWGATGHWLAPGAAVFDAGENGAHLYLLSSQALPPALVAGAALLAGLKWLLLVAAVVSIGLAMRSRHRSRRSG